MSNGRFVVVFSLPETGYKRAIGSRPGGCRLGRRQEHDKGAVRMRLWAGVVRRVGVAVVLVGGIILGGLAGSVATAETAAAQQIVVQGNRRVEASTIQSYFRLG